MELDYPGIYRIDGPNNSVYIGSAASFYFRFKNHQYELMKNKHKNSHLQRAWNKYGADSFSFSVIERIDDKKELRRYEQIWLDILFDCLDLAQIYNKCRTAGTRAGIPLTTEHKEKLRASRIGRKKTEIEIQNIRAGRAKAKNLTPRATIHNIKLVDPMGNVYGPIYNLAAFRREHKLDKKCLYNLINKKIPQYKSWYLQENQG